MGQKFRPGRKIELTLDALDPKGRGLGSHDAYTISVRGAVPGAGVGSCQ